MPISKNALIESTTQPDSPRSTQVQAYDASSKPGSKPARLTKARGSRPRPGRCKGVPCRPCWRYRLTRPGAHIRTRFPRSGSRGFQSLNVIVYGDDLVILHEDHTIIQRCQDEVTTWLHTMGLTLKPSRPASPIRRRWSQRSQDLTSWASTSSNIRREKPGPAGLSRSPPWLQDLYYPSPTVIQRHVDALRQTIARHKHAEQERLIQALNPQIRGWSQYKWLRVVPIDLTSYHM